MKQGNLSIFIGVGLLAAVCASTGLAKSQKRPNVVFILSDDHRADLMSCAGHEFIRTPTLDSIAENGVRFTQGYVTDSL